MSQGRIHSFRRVGEYTFARITESKTGRELWRCRGPDRFELDRNADVFVDLDHFIKTMQHALKGPGPYQRGDF